MMMGIDRQGNAVIAPISATRLLKASLDFSILRPWRTFSASSMSKPADPRHVTRVQTVPPPGWPGAPPSEDRPRRSRRG
jgi:hypothetical protein